MLQEKAMNVPDTPHHTYIEYFKELMSGMKHFFLGMFGI